jgi:hypothetical protein
MTDQERETLSKRDQERKQENARRSGLTPDQRKTERQAFKVCRLAQKETKRAVRLLRMTKEQHVTFLRKEQERKQEQLHRATLSPELRQSERAHFKASKLLARLQKDQEAEQKKQVRDERFQAKLDTMKPEKRAAWDEKQRARKVRQEQLASMSVEERTALRERKNNERLQKKQARIDKMTPESRKEWDRKQAMTKQELKAERIARKAEYTWLSENHTTMQQLRCLSKEDGPKYIIVDGNNMRGGGPNRLSRQQVCDISERRQDDLGIKSILYFDGPVSNCTSDKIEIRYSKDRIADDVIIEDIETMGIKVLVVTVDRGLGIRVLKLNSLTMRNGEYKPPEQESSNA